MGNGRLIEEKNGFSGLIGDYVKQQGSVNKAATNLGISRQCLHRYINGINKPQFRRYEQIVKTINESKNNSLEELTSSFLSCYTTADIIKTRRILLELVAVLELKVAKQI